MNDESSGVTAKRYVAGHNDVFRNCQICDELYPAGTYKEHQRSEKHETTRRARRLAQNAQYQREWRAKQKQERHAG